MRAPVDELDLRILAGLAWKPGDPAHLARGVLRPWDIARALGVHGNTVKARLEEMREVGVLKGVYTVPFGPIGGVTGVGMFWFEFDGPREKNAGVEVLRRSDSVNDVHTYVGGTLRAAVLARGEPLEAAAERLRRAIGARSAELFYRRDGVGGRTPNAEKLTPLDLRVLAALVPDAHRPFSDVAEEVGVTQKTVRARYAGMQRLGVFGIIPHIDLGRMRDLVAFELAVEFEREAPGQVARFCAHFPEAFQHSAHHASNAYLFLAARDTATIEDYVLRAQAVPGVRRARALLVRETWTNNENHLRELRARLAHLEQLTA